MINTTETLYIYILQAVLDILLLLGRPELISFTDEAFQHTAKQHVYQSESSAVRSIISMGEVGEGDGDGDVRSMTL